MGCGGGVGGWGVRGHIKGLVSAGLRGAPPHACQGLRNVRGLAFIGSLGAAVRRTLSPASRLITLSIRSPKREAKKTMVPRAAALSELSGQPKACRRGGQAGRGGVGTAGIRGCTGQVHVAPRVGPDEARFWLQASAILARPTAQVCWLRPLFPWPWPSPPGLTHPIEAQCHANAAQQAAHSALHSLLGAHVRQLRQRGRAGQQC